LLRGIFAATLMPQTETLAVDIELLYNHIQWLMKNGCNGIVLFGTTSEFASFSVAERKEVLAQLSEKNLQKANFIIGTGCSALADTVDLSRHAVDLGYSNLLIIAPFYYKDVNDKGLLAYYDQIIQRMGNSNFQIYLYNFPKMTGFFLSLDLIAHLRALYADTVVGIKDSSGDIENMRAMCKRFPGFHVFSGTERLLTDVLKANGSGCISATANITSQLCAAIFAHWKTKDVSPLQHHLSMVRQEIEKFPLIPALKTIMAEISGNQNWLYLRPPNSHLDNTESEGLVKILKKLQILS
jgi:4-hydroxy-tetrahydrodipicolinate synthase